MTATETSYRNDFLTDMSPALAADYQYWYPWCRDTVLSVVDRLGQRETIDSSLGVSLSDDVHKLINSTWVEPYRGYHQRSGKMLRPVLTSLIIQGLGGDAKKLPEIVAIAEIIHAASLMLDDIADDSPLRRGGPTAHQLVGVRVSGASASAWLNACFELLSWPNDQLQPSQVAALAHEIAWEHWVTGFGTTIDTSWPWLGRFDRSSEEYLQSVVHRSTSYTYRLCLKLGALAAGATQEQSAEIASYGEELGLAFQIVDDILNVAPGDDSWGKVLAEDITQGKINLQVLLALERLDDARKQSLIQILESRTSDQQELNKAVELMRDCGAFDAARDIAMQHVAKTKEIAQSLTFLDERTRTHLVDFVDYVLQRSR